MHSVRRLAPSGTKREDRDPQFYSRLPSRTFPILLDGAGAAPDAAGETYIGGDDAGAVEQADGSGGATLGADGAVASATGSAVIPRPRRAGAGQRLSNSNLNSNVNSKPRGHVDVSVYCEWNVGRDNYLKAEVWGTDLHAPNIERLLEIPMDIHAGRVDGNLVVRF